jgi:hypothetical protein
MKSFEHQTRFSLFYQKQAEVIGELYSLFVETIIATESSVKPMQFAGEKPQQYK